MAYITNDVVDSSALLKLALEFLNGRERLKKLKLRENKKLIGTCLPTPELVLGAGAYPVLPIRMQQFGGQNQQFLNALDLSTSIFGWNSVNKLLKVVKGLDSSNMLENIIHNLLERINFQYNRLYDMTDEYGVPSDSCYGIRAYYGMVADKGKNLSANLNMGLRCSGWMKLYESLQRFTPSIWVDVPLRKTPKAFEFLVDELHKAADQLETITGVNLTNSKLQEACELTNICKMYSRNIIYDIALGDTYPFHPVTLSEYLAFIEILFMDYISDARWFGTILREIYEEMKSRIRNPEFAVDVSSMPKVLFVPRFGGWDSITHRYIYEGGGRTIYAEWDILGYLEPIRTSGDMFENYADYLFSAIAGLGVNNEENSSRIMRFVEDGKIDAVVYNQLFGCHSLSTSYKDLRKKLVREEIPSTIISFNRIGDNREQLKTRIVALMELLQ